MPMARMRVDRDVRQVEIHGLAEHVLAVLGDRARAAAEHRVGRGRAIGGSDMDRRARADLPIDLPEGVEQARVHAGRLVAAPVAQDPVELLEAARVILAVAPEGDGGAFPGVDVVERSACACRRWQRHPASRASRPRTAASDAPQRPTPARRQDARRGRRAARTQYSHGDTRPCVPRGARRPGW